MKLPLVVTWNCYGQPLYQLFFLHSNHQVCFFKLTFNCKTHKFRETVQYVKKFFWEK